VGVVGLGEGRLDPLPLDGLRFSPTPEA
jgi:hypothetical protein